MGGNPSSLRSDTNPSSTRLHYLDWLRVLAIFLVFLFHAVHVFDFFGWQIKNAEQSEILTIILTLFSLWGMPFFFLVAGAASELALRRRTNRQYISERVRRLLVPYVLGSLLFSPLQYYLSWRNHVQLGEFAGSFGNFMRLELPPFDPLRLTMPGFSPKWLAVGFHLWFIGFLFLFAVITLPLFRWLVSERGRMLRSGLAAMCSLRGGLLGFLLPLLVVQFSLRPFARAEHDWADFIFRMAFFVLGFILYADERITRAVRRDGPILLVIGATIEAGLIGLYATGQPLVEWNDNPSLPQFYLVQGLATAVALCFSVAMLYVGMRFLDFANSTLRYCQEAVLPFFIVHQPAIIVIAYFVVQWQASIWTKLPIVIGGSFAVSLGLYEFVIRRSDVLRMFFGMKSAAKRKILPARA